jgi:hypothetical protein
MRRTAYSGRCTKISVFFQGVECGKIRKYSDPLMELLLKSHRPEKYKDRRTTELSGPGGKQIDYRSLSDEELDAITDGD